MLLCGFLYNVIHNSVKLNHSESLQGDRRNLSRFQGAPVAHVYFQVSKKGPSRTISSFTSSTSLKGVGRAKSAVQVQEAGSCSTSPLGRLPFPDGLGCRCPELPFCWKQWLKQPQPAGGSVTGLKSLSQWRGTCPRPSHLPAEKDSKNWEVNSRVKENV